MGGARGGQSVGAGAPKLGAMPNAAGMRDRMAGMLASATPYRASEGGPRPFDAFMNGRAGPAQGQSRADWFAANPNMQRQWNAYRQRNTAGIADWRSAHPPQGGPASGEPRLGLGGHDAQWWKDVGYTPHFVSQLPGMLNQTMALNYGGMDPTTVDWDDPRAIRRAAAFLPMDKSAFSNGGRPMGMNYDANVWGGWKPGDMPGRGVPIDMGYPYYQGGGG